jgi:hypothetical protein
MLSFAQPDGTAFCACLDHVNVEQRNERQALVDVLPDAVQGPSYACVSNPTILSRESLDAATL